MQTFSHPDEHKAMMEKLKISSKFDMRYRGLLEFYSDDLVAYKLKKGSGKHTNEFLRIFSYYLTDTLEDHCPSSWQECQSSFWEKFIFVHYPHDHMTISKKQRDSEIFLLQLRRFVKWLDQRTGTSWLKVVEQYEAQAKSELLHCEKLLNHLFQQAFPGIHQNDWDFEKILTSNTTNHNHYANNIQSIFQVKEVYDDVVTINDIDSDRVYQIVGMPCKLVKPGLLIEGCIGMKKDAFFWELWVTSGVYPARARDYFVFVDTKRQ
ncbi:hypothetical protein [Lentibacillus sp. JNUCC-1]|uniref:hypothetical protein n=1 Tax=Lentibacillus sp. JNUCC-1 TaxID=2654513 RepID=UPI001E3D4CB1|nr:hypothetical protein [Lentibacillus sp. JNUCC-1]